MTDEKQPTQPVIHLVPETAGCARCGKAIPREAPKFFWMCVGGDTEYFCSEKCQVAPYDKAVQS
jgi:hypothetical protein